jgi:hypothetical protein
MHPQVAALKHADGETYREDRREEANRRLSQFMRTPLKAR